MPFKFFMAFVCLFEAVNVVKFLKLNSLKTIYQKADKFGVMDLTGKVVIDSTYESLKEAKSGTFIASKDGKFGIIDMAGQEKLPFQYQSITYQEAADFYVAEDTSFQANILDNNFGCNKSIATSKHIVNGASIAHIIADPFKYFSNFIKVNLLLVFNLKLFFFLFC